MDFSSFIKNNPQMMGQAMGALGGGGGQQQPAAGDAGPGVEPVRQVKDTGEHGFGGALNVVKTLASFYTGGAGGIAKNAVSTAAGGRGSSDTGQAAASAFGGFGGGGGGNYSQAAQQAGGSDWLKKFSGGYGG
jgi:hypothetical protein